MCCALRQTEEVVLDFCFKYFHVFGRKLELSEKRIMVTFLLLLFGTVPPHLFEHPLPSWAHTLARKECMSAQRETRLQRKHASATTIESRIRVVDSCPPSSPHGIATGTDLPIPPAHQAQQS